MLMAPSAIAAAGLLAALKIALPGFHLNRPWLLMNVMSYPEPFTALVRSVASWLVGLTPVTLLLPIGLLAIPVPQLTFVNVPPDVAVTRATAILLVGLVSYPAHCKESDVPPGRLGLNVYVPVLGPMPTPPVTAVPLIWHAPVSVLAPAGTTNAKAPSAPATKPTGSIRFKMVIAS
jgi:hypothetical protein